MDENMLNSTTPEFRTELAKQLEELMPEAIADGKVDIVKLKELLAEDAGDTNERFGLFWPGKKRAMRAAQESTTATLKPAPELSKDWDSTQNIFIEGDNLEVLKVLQKQYHNSIKMIYIDPPYNTGKDFVYPDNFKEGLQNYLEFSKQVDEGNKKISTNTETAGRYHSNWLNMMYPRLKLARNLLTDDGVIFISIDDAEQANLKRVCDEVFGENNFIATFLWQKNYSPKNNNKFVSDDHDFILAFARNKEALNTLNRLPRTEKSDSFYSHDDNDGKGLYGLDNLTVPGGKQQYVIDWQGKTYTAASTRGWAYSEQRMHELIDEGRIYFPDAEGSRPRYKRYLSEVPGLISKTILSYDVVGHTDGSKKALDLLIGGNIFDFPKPVELIKYFSMLGSFEDSVILDFFSGSGTTAHAVMQLNAEDGGNRKHIQVQLPEPTDEKSEAYKAGYKTIAEIARERINRAGEKIKTDFADKLAERSTPLDIGYCTYKLADTNFRKWQSSATADLGELQARLDLMRESADDNASEADLLVEIMLKMGLPLTTHTQPRDVAGLSVHQVVHEANDSEDGQDDVQPVFYLNEHIKPTLEQLRAIVTELNPSKFVILDDAFQGDNQLKTNLVQTCKTYDVEFWTV